MRPNFQLNNVEIYMDNAATTALDEAVVAEMRPYFEERYGNPETVYRLGRESKKAVEDSRAKIADILKCAPEEIFFTSGGTEANNWAIKGHFNRNGNKGILYGAIEHSSVFEPILWMDNPSTDVSSSDVRVDKYGLIDLDILETYLKMDKIGFVSIQYANNEIGTVQPVEKIAELCKKYGAIFHCDAVQAFGKIDFDVDDVGADMISLSAHKIHGPMGMGALYVKRGTQIGPLLHGGGQERGMRSGTLAVPEIVGFGKAAELAIEAIPKHMPRLMKITEWLVSQLCLSIDNATRNGHPTRRLPNIVSLTIPNMESEVVCGIMCAKHNTCMSAGAACSTTKKKSHVLEAIGRDAKDVLSTLRISLSRYTKDSDVLVVYGQIQAANIAAKARSLI
jgi:cysteine desulfurase